MIAESLIINACSLLEYEDQSGYRPEVPPPASPLSATRFRLSVNSSEKRLKMIHKASGAAIWFKHNDDDAKVVSGQFSDEDLIAQDMTTCAITATVSDPSGHYLPRTLAVTLADKSTHTVGLYRSVKGTPVNQSGTVRGTITTKTGDTYTRLPWTLITLTVTPETGAALKFIAQADQHGEYVIALNGPKLQSVNDPSKPFSATLKFEYPLVSRAEQPANPDILIDRKVCHAIKQEDGSLEFADKLDILITAGMVNTPVSPGQRYLVLQAS